MRHKRLIGLALIAVVTVAAISGCSYNKFTGSEEAIKASGDRCRTSCSGATTSFRTWSNQ